MDFLPSWCTYIQVGQPVESWLFHNKPVSFPTKKGDSYRLLFSPKPSLAFPMAQFSTGHCIKLSSRPKILVFLRKKNEGKTLLNKDAEKTNWNKVNL